MSATARRRRTPEIAKAEILAAAKMLLRERPLYDLAVDDVMHFTGLSRPSFYVYFRDIHDLVGCVVDDWAKNCEKCHAEPVHR